MRRAQTLWHYGKPLVDRYGTLAWLILLGLSGALFITHNRGEITAIGPHLRQADLRWFALAVLCQITVEILIAQKFRVLLGRLGYAVGRATIMRSHLYRHVISTVIPFGGPAGIVGFARDLGTTGVAMPDALYASMLSSIASESAFLVVLLPTVVWLLVSSRAGILVVAGAGMMVALLSAVIAVVVIALRSATASSPLGRRLPRRAREMLDQLREHSLRPHDLAGPAALALGVNLSGIVMLYASLRAVGADAPLSTVIAARMIASVVMLLAPIFQGAGAVEFTAAGILAGGGVPMASALAAMVLFRIGQFWLPITAGALTRLRVAPIAPASLGRWLQRGAVSVAVGLMTAAIVESAASQRVGADGHGPLERANLAGLFSAMAVFALSAQLHRQADAVRRPTVATATARNNRAAGWTRRGIDRSAGRS